MFRSWWENVIRRDPPLTRNPSVGRPRTYSAESGYVYQYVFSGYRHLSRRNDRLTEYVFEVTSGRGPAFATKIVLSEFAMRCSVADGRDLSASERFGIAKLALKRSLDTYDHPSAVPAELIVAEHELREISEILDL
jgi:hypothetical protein